MAYSMLEMISNGIGSGEKIFNQDKMNEMVLEILPHQKKFLQDHPTEGIFFLTGELANVVEARIRDSLAGHSADKSELERATRVLGLANELQTAAKNSVSQKSAVQV